MEARERLERGEEEEAGDTEEMEEEKNQVRGSGGR